MFVVLSSCMLMCVCVCARAGRAMLVGHSMNDLCKFLLSPFQKKQKGGGVSNVLPPSALWLCGAPLWKGLYR